MRTILTTLAVIGCFVVSLSASQARGAAAAGKKSAIHACSLLTKELVQKVSPLDQKQLAFLLKQAPDDDPTGSGGSDCDYGGITLTIDPTAYGINSYKNNKEWQPVANVGDAAMFHDNKGMWAELVVQSGSHLMGIRMTIPAGKTAASVKPNAIALAAALVPMLK